MVSLAGNSTVTLPMSYEDTTSILSYVGKPKRWRDLRPFEKMLASIIGVMSFICFALIIAVAVIGTKLTHNVPVTNPPERHQQNTTAKPGNVGTTTPAPVTSSTHHPATGSPSGTHAEELECLDSDCVEAAGLMLSVMDLSVDPCRDFYKYACGNWETMHPIPDAQSTWDQFDVVKERITRELHDLLSDGVDEHSDPEPVQMAHKFYVDCVSQNDESNYTALKELIEHLLSDYDHNLWSSLGHLRRVLGGNYVFTLKVGLDEKDAAKHVIYLDQPSFGLARAHLVERNYYHDAYVQAYEALIEESWEKIFRDKRQAEAAANIIYFERALAENAMSSESRLNKTSMYNEYTIAELYELTDAAHVKMDWEHYFDEVFFEIYDPEKKGTAWNNTRIIVKDVHFFHMLETAFEGNKTHQVIRDYLTWRIILTLSKDVTVELRDLFYSYEKLTEGLQVIPPLWKVCVEESQKYFGMALSYHYIQENFHEDHLKEMREILENIKNTMRKVLLGSGELNWLSRNTRLRAVDKINRLHTFIGHPEWLVDGGHSPNHPLLITQLMEYYYHLQLDKNNDHFDNVVEILEWKSRENLKEFANPRDFNKWLVDPLDVIALYWPGHNALTLPAGLLQPPFFGGPLKYLNYGAIGSLIGHIIIHIFDNKGRQYGPTGALQDWWDADTVESYEGIEQCYIKRFTNFTGQKITIPIHWKQSLIEESLADSLGLKLAYQAYEAYLSRERVEEKLLPGFNVTADQLFFLSYAQMWCTDYRTEFASSIKGGWFTPTQFRAYGGLHNSNEFRQAWSCPALPPATSCHIW